MSGAKTTPTERNPARKNPVTSISGFRDSKGLDSGRGGLCLNKISGANIGCKPNSRGDSAACDYS